MASALYYKRSSVSRACLTLYVVVVTADSLPVTCPTTRHEDALPLASPVLQTTIARRLPDRHGKVRDIYDFGDRLLIVATDRMSAFDYVLGSGIPDKGKVLTQISAFWFDRLRSIVPHHLLSVDPAAYPPELAGAAELLRGRS